jgi:hypothetical protein
MRVGHLINEAAFEPKSTADVARDLGERCPRIKHCKLLPKPADRATKIATTIEITSSMPGSRSERAPTMLLARHLRQQVSCVGGYKYFYVDWNLTFGVAKPGASRWVRCSTSIAFPTNANPAMPA